MGFNGIRNSRPIGVVVLAPIDGAGTGASLLLFDLRHIQVAVCKQYENGEDMVVNILNLFDTLSSKLSILIVLSITLKI